MNEIARGVVGWDCPAGVGHPVCITVMDGSDDSLSTNLFLKDGDIVGVCVYKDCDLVAAVGQLPIAVVNQERNILGFSPLDPSVWVTAESIYTEVTT